ncbi:MAG: hypothetical protein K9J06_14380 [Flavobacteriales bacterium]|nr:hypothetical protein [Flavobacteriales bacterium]
MALTLCTSQLAFGQITPPPMAVLPLSTPQDGSLNYHNKASELVHLQPGYGYTPQGSGNFMHAFIDPSIILPASYTGGSPSGSGEVWPPQIDASKAVGFTPGAHGVSHTGAATYDIPIQLPPGTAGMVPSLSISYNSQGGNGLLGMGWNMGGLSAISRVPKTIYHDLAVRGVQLDADDIYALDGNRLVALTGVYGAEGTMYGTEQETFAQIISHGSVSGKGPEWFEVKTKEGLTMEYGRDHIHTVSRFLTNHPIAGERAVITHRINKMTDPYGNYVTYKYRTEGRQSVIDEIRYTGNDNAGVQPYNVIQFEYMDRDDKNTVYVMGPDSDVKSHLLLRKIRIIADGQHFKNYVFEYGTNGMYSFLKSVTESGSNGEELNSTVMRYGEVLEEMVTVTEREILMNENVDIITGDFNGDGLTDIATSTKSVIGNITRHIDLKIYFNKGDDEGLFYTSNDLFADLSDHTYNMPSNHGYLNYYSLSMGSSDFNGDGRDDIVVLDLKDENGVELDKVVVYSVRSVSPPDVSGTPSFILESTEYNPPTEQSTTQQGKNLFFTGDFDGDGTTDYLTAVGSAFGDLNEDGQVDLVDVGLFFATDWSMFGRISYLGANLHNIDIDVSGITQGSSISLFQPNDRVFVLDHNGDGKHDLMVVTETGTFIYDFEYDATQHKVIPRLICSVSIPSYTDLILLGDFNGDGKTDVLTEDQGNWNEHRSNGRGFSEGEVFNFISITSPYLVETPLFGIMAMPLGSVLVSDFNGDGKSDVLHVQGFLDPDLLPNEFSVSETRLIYYLSNGNDFEHVEAVVSGKLNYPDLKFGDFNGDGKMEITSRNDDSSPVQFIYLEKEVQPLLNHEIVNGYGYSVGFTYANATWGDTYRPGHVGDEQATRITPVGLPLLRSIEDSDGIGGMRRIDIAYTEARMHRKGNGFMGFAEIDQYHYSTMGMTHRTNTVFGLDQDFWVSFTTNENTYADMGNQSLLFQKEYEYLVSPGSNIGSFQLLPKMVSETDHINDFSTTTTVDTYDPYGNPTNVITISGSETTETNLQYITFGDWHVPSRLRHSNTTVALGGVECTRTMDYTYNAQGSASSEIADQYTAKQVATLHQEWDDFGNTTKSVLATDGNPWQTREYTFDSKGRFMVKEKNPLQQETTHTYDNRWGKPLTTEGITGLTSSFQYDAFGRDKKVTDPLGIISNTAYSWDAGPNGNAVYAIETTAPGSAPTKSWFDLLGREVHSLTEGFGQQNVYVKTAYDARGRVAEVVTPNAAGGIATTTTIYDNFDRIESVTSPAGTIGYGYASSNGLLTTTTTNTTTQQVRSGVTDATGKQVSATDAGGVLEYGYHPSGNLDVIIMDGQQQPLATMGYDCFGHQQGLDDANAGESSYVYDALGQLKRQTVNGHAFDMLYDVMGRPTSRTGPELLPNGSTQQGVTEYLYVVSGNGLNQIEKVTSPNGTTQEYTYDDHDRMASFTETIEDEEFTTSYTYDNYGRVKDITYPTGFTITYSYDENGHLTSVSGNGTSLYTLGTKNPLGQVTGYVLGNGKVTTRVYDDLGMPKYIYTEDISELFTDFDPPTGNLKSRRDMIKDIEEFFFYDNLDRLRRVEMDGLTMQEIDIDANGNILEKTDAGIYEYGDDRPNAVTSITNGPQEISYVTQDITYTTHGSRTASITEGLHRALFTYGPDNERKKMELQERETESDPWVTVSTRYYHGAYEELHMESTDDIYRLHYISGGDGLCAIHVMQNDDPEGDSYYVYKDHLGSILALTDADGDVEHEQSFDAWGRYRDSEIWQALNSNPSDNALTVDMPVWMSRGYTGHEHIKEFDLINMNGRMYDPTIGRMLTPDNVVQEPYNTQSHNRYVYVFNNPLRYVDPTGNTANDYWGDMDWSFGMGGYMPDDWVLGANGVYWNPSATGPSTTPLGETYLGPEGWGIDGETGHVFKYYAPDGNVYAMSQTLAAGVTVTAIGASGSNDWAGLGKDITFGGGLLTSMLGASFETGANFTPRYAQRGVTKANLANETAQFSKYARYTSRVGNILTGTDMLLSGVEYHYSDKSWGDKTKLGLNLGIAGLGIVRHPGAQVLSIGLGIAETAGAFNGLYNYADFTEQSGLIVVPSGTIPHVPLIFRFR